MVPKDPLVPLAPLVRTALKVPLALPDLLELTVRKVR